MLSNNMLDLVKTELAKGQELFADSLKLMVQKKAEQLFDLLDPEDQAIFLEPMLFAYLNSDEMEIGLDQILFGYCKKSVRPQHIQVVSNSEGQIIMPNIGYFQLPNKASHRLDLFTNPANNAFQLYNGNTEIKHILKSNPMISNTTIEYVTVSNALIDPYFKDRSTTIKSHENYLKALNTAVDILKVEFPGFYECFRSVMRWIMPFESATSNSFATMSVHGAAFLNMNENCDEVFCIEDIAHQCGHVILNAMTHDRNEYFKIDAETPLKEFTSEDDEHRSIYVAFHGVFTEGLMNRALDTCLSDNIFHGHQEHELKGRLVYILIRFLLDMESLNHAGIFTDKGQYIYTQLQREMIGMYRKYSALLQKYDLSNQSYNFDYSTFTTLNPVA